MGVKQSVIYQCPVLWKEAAKCQPVERKCGISRRCRYNYAVKWMFSAHVSNVLVVVD